MKRHSTPTTAREIQPSLPGESVTILFLDEGFGTLDETFEIVTWTQLGLVSMPTVFLDTGGYFDPLFEFGLGFA